jgi:hypothetical protein
MTIIVSQPVLEFTDKFWWIDEDSEGWNLAADSLKLSLVDFTVEKSADSDYHVILVKTSRGRSASDARKRAEKIQYSISSNDSVLDIGNGFAIDKDSKYRGQMIEIKVQVPVGKKIRFDESITRKLHPVEVKEYRRSGRLRRTSVNIDYRDWFEYRTDVDYVMSESGSLVDPNKPPKSPTPPPQPGDYRYDENQKETIEQREKRLDEERRQLEEDKKKLKLDSIKGSSKNESMDDEDDSGEAAGSPVFSLFQVFN